MSKQQNTGKRVGSDARVTGPQGSPSAKPPVGDRMPPVGSKAPRTVQSPEKRVSGPANEVTGTGSRGGPQTKPRSRTVVPPPKSGFSVRPLDLALVVIGLIVVGLIVWSSIGNSGNSPAAQPVPQTTSVAAGPTATLDPKFPNPLKVGVVAPDFSLPSPDGQTYTLSQYKGKVVFLELFAPWCPHCQADAPIVNQVYDKYKDKGVQFLMVSASPWSHTLEDDQTAQRTPTPISMSDMTWFRDNFKVQFPILFDQNVKAAEGYGLAYYPTIYIIDKDGKVASMPAGNYVWENGNPVSQPEASLSLDFLSSKLDAVIK